MQRQKIQTTGLAAKVDLILISEEIGYAKPAPESFKIACDRLGIVPGHVLYIGDDPRIDIDGATNAGLHTALLVRKTASGEAALENLTSRILTQ
ncbi:HAD superfamily hydrolase (TIGR01509 family) [Microbacterium foliorum]|uniref:HAD superfamily hydrolase (TIGR01509 family) n=2 Tax=Microbacterium foliorum TaxID=104336 RepID=A0ABU1HQF0_9MICO|nr:HAD superfamily hydrolase (TIGR01509 family) [Microbacterium foliorum]